MKESQSITVQIGYGAYLTATAEWERATSPTEASHQLLARILPEEALKFAMWLPYLHQAFENALREYLVENYECLSRPKKGEPFEDILCACGCGEAAQRRYPTYKRGHKARKRLAETRDV